MRCSGCLPASSNRSMPRSVPATVKRPARYSMSPGAASSASPASALRVLDRALGRDLHRRAAGEERARAGAAEAVAAVGVALDDADLLDRHAEDVDRELRVAGRDALPHRLRRREDLDDAVGRDVDADLLLEDVAAGPFEERRDAAAAQLAARLRLARAAPRSRSSRRAPGPGRGSARTRRCRRSAPSGSCTASARAGSCCGGAARRDRSSSRARPRRTAAR